MTVKEKIEQYHHHWRHRKPTTGAIVSEEEVSSFKLFFASIEVVLGEEQEWRRIYFPVPQECREQAHNHFVKDRK
jgi:hypothetical protein